MKENREVFPCYGCKDEAVMENEIEMSSLRREIKQFAGAKKKEVNQYIEQEVLEQRTPEYAVPKDRVLRCALQG